MCGKAKMLIKYTLKKEKEQISIIIKIKQSDVEKSKISAQVGGLHRYQSRGQGIR